MSDPALQVFMESQKETNQRLTDTMTSIAETVSRLEQEAVRYEAVAGEVEKIHIEIDTVKDTLNAHSIAIEFVKGARKIFIAVLTALILAGGGIWFQAYKASLAEQPSPTDKLLIEVLKELKKPKDG